MKARWTTLALQRLREARLYIEVENPRTASAIGSRIEEGVDRLALFPEMGRTGRRAGTRELVIPATNFIVAYRVMADTIDVLAVLHGARKWPERL
ncbi:MAG: type II toxin-antitoxin system RelE/ParE family toxin [Acidobacteriaceae bacterium]